jgi:hypothetical protein
VFSFGHLFFLNAGKSEQANYKINMKRKYGAPMKDPKTASKTGSTLALLLPRSVLVWVLAWYKVWEGRTVRSCLRMWGRLPVVGDRISLAAGCGKNGIMYCVVKDVVVANTAREVVNGANWKQFVPWVSTLTEARGVYNAMDVGCGFVFMRLSDVYRTENIGFR